MNSNSKDSFFVTLFSNDSLAHFSQNTLSNFTNYIDPPIFVDNTNDWLVGVTEIFLNDWTPVIPDYEHDRVKLFFKEQHQKCTIPYTIDPYLYKQGEVHLLKKMFIKGIPLFLQHPDNGFSIRLDAIDAIDVIEGSSVDIYVKEAEKIIETFTDNLAYLAFEKKRRLTTSKTANTEKLPESPSEGFFFVYTDIICGRRVGSQNVKVIKIIGEPCRGAKRFNNVEYFPLETDYIRTIGIKITNQQGELINFDKSYTPTMLTLHFIKLK